MLSHPAHYLNTKLFIFSSAKSGYREGVLGRLQACVLRFWFTALRERESAGAALGREQKWAFS